ncbi:MAG TPA: hypothetical protein VHS76_09235 [Steroidobacteraceae bacterium]|nr:hypothetical protein [Steroidobacteraceae bacterium]
MTGRVLHTREQFALIANAPFDLAWPLFGAHRERDWAPGWNPSFVWPERPADREGMVFEVGRGDTAAIWVNTVFDPTARSIQYVCLMPHVLVTVITLKLEPKGHSMSIEVVYERTALAEAANEIVRDMAAGDRVAGEEWSLQINTYLHQSQAVKE